MAKREAQRRAIELPAPWAGRTALTRILLASMELSDLGKRWQQRTAAGKCWLSLGDKLTALSDRVIETIDSLAPDLGMTVDEVFAPFWDAAPPRP